MNRVLLSLSIAALATFTLLPLVHFAPNRFIGGQAQSLAILFAQHAGWIIAFISGLLGLIVLGYFGTRFGRQRVAVAAALLAGLLWLLLLLFLAESANSLTRHQPPAARVTIGSGFWLTFLFLNFILLDAWQHLQNYHRWFFAWLLLLAAAILWAWSLDTFEALSLIKEYRNHQERFTAAVIRHTTLVLLAFVPTLLLGLSLGYTVWRYPRYQRIFFPLLNFLQTVPSIALFALLMLPLSALVVRYPRLQDWGISGIGVAPAVIALLLYTLLPLVRNTFAGLNAVPGATLEAARCMGMRRGQIFRHVIVPLSLPVVLSGVRIAIVQAIGLTVVAALIGAGGLGIFVWEGLGQNALDLVLLGAIPTIFLALLADLLLQGLIKLSQAQTSVYLTTKI